MIKEATYRWLTPEGTSALALCWVSAPLLAGAFGLALPPGPRLSGLRGVDQALVVPMAGGAVLCVHGGGAVRAALTLALAAAGGREFAAPIWSDDPRTARIMEALPGVRGALGVQLLLAAARHGRQAAARVARMPGRDRVLSAWAQARYLFASPRVQLWGPVNAGKSSLLNALCGRELARTGPEAGLTRDVIEGEFEYQGFVVQVFDAPGTRESPGELDRAAAELAAAWRQRADVTLHVVPPGHAAPAEGMHVYSRADEDSQRRVPGVSMHDPAAMAALKARLRDHFIGALLALEPELRVAWPPDVLDELATRPEAALENLSHP